MSLLAILDWQHQGKPGRADVGATVEQCGGTVTEVDLTRAYIDAACHELADAGASVRVLTSGWYKDRHQTANQTAAGHQGPVAYVACHVNAGGGDYCLALHDLRSSGGGRLASSVMTSVLDAQIDGLERTITRQAASTGSWRAAFATIRGIYDGPANISGVCFEPFFIDSIRHAHLTEPDGLKAVGKALAAGILHWAGKDITT